MSEGKIDIAYMFDELKDVIHRWKRFKRIEDEVTADLLPWIQKKAENYMREEDD